MREMKYSADDYAILPCCEIKYCTVVIDPNDDRKVSIVPVRISYCPICGASIAVV